MHKVKATQLDLFGTEAGHKPEQLGSQVPQVDAQVSDGVVNVQAIIALAKAAKQEIDHLGLKWEGHDFDGARTLLWEIVAGDKVLQAAPKVVDILRRGNPVAIDFAEKFEALLRGADAKPMAMDAVDLKSVPAETPAEAETLPSVEEEKAVQPPLPVPVAPIDVPTHALAVAAAEPPSTAATSAPTGKKRKRSELAVGKKNQSTPASVSKPEAVDKVLLTGDKPATAPVSKPAEIVMVPISDIKLSDKLSALLKEQPDVLQDIKEGMQVRGFYSTTPVILDKKDGTVVDGHNRLAAAKAAGLTEIPAIYMEFKTTDEAADFAIESQVNRRNLEDGDLIALMGRFGPRFKHGGARRGKPVEFKTGDQHLNSPVSTKELAKRLHTSPDKIGKLEKIKNSGDKKTIAAVEHGAMTANAAVNKLKAQKPKAPGEILVTAAKYVKKAAEVLRADHRDLAAMVDDVLMAIEERQGKASELVEK